MWGTLEGEVAPAGLWTEPADPTVRSTFCNPIAFRWLVDHAVRKAIIAQLLRTMESAGSTVR